MHSLAKKLKINVKMHGEHNVNLMLPNFKVTFMYIRAFLSGRYFDSEYT
jgi:hypothetical protein